VVQSYGTGRATLMSNCTGNNVPLFDIGGISGVTVQNLKFVAGHPAGTHSGIMIEGPGDTIVVRNNEVTGLNINSVGSEILVVGLGAYTQSGCNPLTNIQILNNDLHWATPTSTDDNGIYGWGCNPNISGAYYAGNHIWNLGGGSSNPPFSPNGIAANGTINAVIEHNLIHDIGANQTTCGGPTGIIIVNGTATIQFNEVYRVAPMADQGLGCDWVGIDFDIDGTGTAQYNYVHDNAGACLLSYGKTGPNTFRYSMCENNDALHKSGGEISIAPNSSVSVYNNTMFESGQDPTNTEPSCFFFGYNGATAPGSVFKNNLCVLARLNIPGN